MIARIVKALHLPDLLPITFLIAWQFVYFFPVTIGQSVWFTTDIQRLYYPFALELQRALDTGHLPLWTNGILAGFPLFAEGQVGALYPLNLLLLKFLPAYSALSFGVLIHLAFAASGMYLFVRALRVRVAGALLAGFVFAFNGWTLGHLSHLSIIAAVGWLPWSLYFLMRFQKSHAGIWFLFIALAVAAEYVSGSVQLAFLNSLAFVAIGAADAFFERRPSRLLYTILPFVLGLGIAAAQLIPTAELVGYSVRSGTDASFFSSFSLPLEFLQQFIAPFFQGEPSEGTGEYWGYFGFAPLLLLLAAPFLKRDGRTWFYFLFAVIALSLATGGNNPLFQLLFHLPLFGLFRVPARYLYLFTFSAAICAALVLDDLANRFPPRRLSPYWIAAAPAALILVYLAHSQPLELWLVLWRGLPFLLVLVLVLLGALGFKRNLSRENFIGLVLTISVLDLAVYAPPFLKTIDELAPIATVTTQPRTLSIFQHAPERVFTDLSVFPSPPALRASMYPNMGILYAVPSAQGYTSLALGRHEAFLSQASPAMLDLMNARWFAVPLEPRPAEDRLTPPSQFALAVGEGGTQIAPTEARGIQVSSFTEQAQDLSDGSTIAVLHIFSSDNSSASFPLRLGIETADWDYDRKNRLSPNRAPVAHSFPAFWRSFGKAFEGHSYLAQFDFSTRVVTGLSLSVIDPNAQFHLEQISLLDANAQLHPLSAGTNRNNFTLAYLSDTAAIWENHDALPRAFIVHGAEVADDSDSFTRMQDASFDPRQTALLSEGRPLSLSERRGSQDVAVIGQSESERVTISVQTDTPGYLILLDSWYPGWSASVDDSPAPIHRVDALFRAVPIDPGSHKVVFVYQPQSLILGAGISLASLVLTIGIAVAMRHKRDLSI